MTLRLSDQHQGSVVVAREDPTMARSQDRTEYPMGEQGGASEQRSYRQTNKPMEAIATRQNAENSQVSDHAT